MILSTEPRELRVCFAKLLRNHLERFHCLEYLLSLNQIARAPYSRCRVESDGRRKTAQRKQRERERSNAVYTCVYTSSRHDQASLL